MAPMDLAAQRLRHALSPHSGDSRLLHLTNVRPLTCTNYNNNHHIICVSCDRVSAAPIKVITFWWSEDI